MKKIVAPLLGFLMLTCIFSSPAQTTFRFSYDVGAFDIAGGMVENPAGEFVIAGLNNSFGPYYGNAVKISNTGTVVWAKAYTGGFATNFSDIKNVSAANGGGYIITGSSTSGGGGALLVRIDNAGAVIWAKRYQLPDKPAANASSEYGSSVIETSDGGFLVGGGVDYFWDGVSATTTDTTSAMGFKVDAGGNLLWSKVWTITTANPDEHYINDVAEVADGYFFVGQSSEGSGTLSSNGDYPSNALVIKTTTAGALTYLRRWGAGNTTSQSINSALKLANGNVLLGGIDDVNAFLVTMTGPGAAVSTTGLNRRINGAAFPPRTLIIQDIMENSDGNYSVIGMQIDALSFTFYTAIFKINSSTGALIFGRGYTPIGLSAILPEGGLAADQGYYVGMTDQQAGGFNYNVIRTDATGQLGAAAGCGSTALNPTTAAYSVTFSTPGNANFNLATSGTFTPTVTNMTPVVTQHCLNTVCVPPAAATSVTATPATICAGQTSTINASGPATGVTYNVFTTPAGGSSIGTTPLVVSPGTTTTYYVETTTSPTCVSTTRPSVTVTVTPVVTPVTGFSYTSPVCANGTNPSPIPVAGFTGGGTYTSTAGLTLNAGTGVITLSSSTPGTYTVTYTVAASGCNPAGSSTASITITPNTTPGTSFSYASPVCANAANPSPTPGGGFTAGGTYSSTAGLSINAGTGVINLSASTPGTYTVTYTVAASGCQLAGSGTANITITPNTTPGTSFSYPTPVCANAGNPSPTPGGGFTAGGTYSSTAGLSINSGTGVINLSASTPGTYTITYSVAASGCQLAGSGTASITINPVTTPVTGFSYTSPVCANAANPSPTPVAGFTSGGTYSSTAGLTVNSGTGLIDLSTSTPGTYTVTYSVAASTCGPAGSSTANITITPNTTPGTSFSYPTPVCANAANPSPTAGSGFTTGGTYSSTAGLTVNSGTGLIDLSTSTPGTYTVTYAVAASGCQLAGSGTANITIDPTTAPVTSFSYTSPVCANGTNPTPAPAGGFTTGGTYSSTTGLTIDPATGNIDLATTTPGTYTVTYSVPASGCATAGSSTASITIDPTTSPVTTFSYATPVCANGTNPVVIAGGGFTSTSGLTINPSTGDIDLTTTTPGAYTVTYTVAASGCMVAGTGTANITINPVTTPVTGFSYTSPVCANAANPSPIPTGGFTTGGIYSSTAGLSVNASTGVIDLPTSTPGTYTVTYDVAATACGPAGSSTASITIDPVITPVTGFTYTTPVCANGTNPVPIPGSGFTTGGTYTSASGVTIDPSTGVIDLSTTTPGTYTVTYSVAASGCTAAGTGTASITINPVTAPVTGFTYSSGTSVCSNGTNPAPVPTAGFTTGGTYSSTAGLTVNTGTGIVDLSTSTPGTYTVTYSVPATACGPAGSSSTSLTINAAPSATAGSTAGTVCSGSSVNLTSSGGSSYSWTGPNTFTSPSQSPVITGATTAASGTYTVVVTGSNGCSATATTAVTVNPTPAISISGSSSICSGASSTLTASGAGTYSWSTGAGTAAITVNPATTTSYTVTGTSSGCTATQAITVTVNTPPVASINGGGSAVCAGQSVTLTASGGPPYAWSTGATTAGITVNPAVTTTYSVVVGSGCTDTASVLVAVNPLPTPVITGATTVISGSSTTLTATGGTSYVWSPATGLSCADCPSPVATPTVTTQYCVTSFTGGCSDSACVIVDVDIKCGELFVPNAFSPNADGENDMLFVMGNCIRDLNFAIFDRWGEKVFETSDPLTGWDGSFRGKALDTSVLVYYLSATVDGVEVKKHGNITLVK
jgi:gliding motility-associated-like protein